MIRSSAHSKVILFGEHSVVYGKHAIAAPINEFSTEVSLRQQKNFHAKVDLKYRSLETGEKEKLVKLIRFYQENLEIKENFLYEINSDIPLSSGLGSSASLCVSLAKALMQFRSNTVDTINLLKLSHEGENIFHGKSSGLDTTVIGLDKAIFFTTEKMPDTIRIKKPLHLIIIGSGEKSDTKKAVAKVRKQYHAKPKEYKKVFEDFEEVAVQAKIKMEEGDLKSLGKLMDINHKLLKLIDISTPKLDKLVGVARKNGAYGAKLCGGGLGGCAISLVKKNDIQKIKNSLIENGAERIYDVDIK